MRASCSAKMSASSSSLVLVFNADNVSLKLIFSSTVEINMFVKLSSLWSPLSGADRGCNGGIDAFASISVRFGVEEYI